MIKHCASSVFGVIFLIVCISFSSCKKDEDDSDAQDSGVDVHVAGREGYVAKYWKNGKGQMLGLGTRSSDALGLFVSGNDVFACGWEMNSEGKYVARYWINGEGTDLTDGRRDAMAYDMVLVGEDLYIAGREMVEGGSTWIAKYWKNGEPVSLGSETDNTVAASIAVYQNDVYVIGERRRASELNPRVCYWKNGEVFYLSDENTYASDQDLFVADGDLYMLWSYTVDARGTIQTRYSKNLGNPEQVDNSSSDFRGRALFTAGNDVYVAGTGSSPGNDAIAAQYWKNGAVVTLTAEPPSALSMDIFHHENDVYVAGSIENANRDRYGLATYWKNGEVVMLTDGRADGLARKIVVQRK